MARMYPAEVFSGCPSVGEREVFYRLKDSQTTESWIVLHSLDIANHVRQISGEADFVVIVPFLGVVCLEVKACRRLRRDQAGWFYGSDVIPDARGPFRQASEAMHSLRNQLVKKRAGLAYVLFWSAVVFPYVSFDVRSEEWQEWQVIDAAAFRRYPLPERIENVLRKARSFLSSCPGARWYKPERSSDFTIEQAEEVAQLLRPSFEVFETPKVRQARWSEEVRRYTEEQLIALDTMHANPRVLFAGPAGTGKTLLAIESARRAHSAGEKCLLVCFNRFLGKWLQEQLSPLADRVTTCTFHSLLLSFSALLPPEGAGSDFWEEKLPEAAIEALIGREPQFEPFDSIIIDEAQDLIKSCYLDVFDLLVRGGLSSGRWRFFGDFERQAIYNSDAEKILAALKARAGPTPIFSLRTNCRNSPRIATLAHLLGGLTPDYLRVLRPDNGIEPDVRYFENSGQQETLLLEVLESWYEEGLNGNEIVILSPRADRACLAAQVNKEPWRSRLRPYSESTGNHISYASIHSFKGLEAPAIIVSDVEHLTAEASMNLFYVAVTRALQRLTVLLHESARNDVFRALTGCQADKMRN